MKKILALVMILVIVALCVFAALSTDTNNATTDNTETLSDVELQEATDAEATNESVPAASVMYDADGKAYFVGDEYAAYQMALDADLQERMDLAIMGEVMVYDIVRQGDSTMVDTDGNEINLRYGISNEEIPEEVTVLRDGFAVFTWDEENFECSDKTDKVFVGATDSKFTSNVYCVEHKAIFARETTGYPEALEWAEGDKKGLRGPFDTAKLDNDIFNAFVLVRRTVNINGENQIAFTWVVRICGCNQPGQPSNPGNPVVTNPTAAPTDAPTQEPTESPTQEPTEEPTEEPTQEPTQEPTVAPSFNPQPTQQATQAPTVTVAPSFNPQPTQQATQAPTVTVAPTAAPTEEPPVFNFDDEDDDTEEDVPNFSFGSDSNSESEDESEEQTPSFSFGSNSSSSSEDSTEEKAPSFSFNSTSSSTSTSVEETEDETPSFGFGSTSSNNSEETDDDSTSSGPSFSF